MNKTLLGDIKDQDISESLTLVNIVQKYINNQFTPLSGHMVNMSERGLLQYQLLRRETLQVIVPIEIGGSGNQVDSEVHADGFIGEELNLVDEELLQCEEA